MRNITVSIEDETYRLSRIKAAELQTSVSALVREYLLSLVRGCALESDFDHRRRLQDEVLEGILARGGGLASVDNLSREALYYCGDRVISPFN